MRSIIAGVSSVFDMMFYRRKIILGLIEILGGDIDKLQLQKLLFLYGQKKANPEYDFVPYKFGCYSFSAKADMNTMVKKGLLSESDTHYWIEGEGDYFKHLKKSDKQFLDEVRTEYGKMSSNNLIKHTYINFPYFATKSTIACDLLTSEQYERVKENIPNQDYVSLFTIGYEGVSLEKYLGKLLKNNVKLLVDVRRNPVSMKFGFSKSTLKRYCNSLDIDYIHMPEVGIASDKRQQLNSKEDYDTLFALYANTTLQQTNKEQKEILALLTKYKRIALTCFEADAEMYHRSHLVSSINKLAKNKIPITHL